MRDDAEPGQRPDGEYLDFGFINRLDPQKMFYTANRALRKRIFSNAPEDSIYNIVPGQHELETFWKERCHGRYERALSALELSVNMGNGYAMYELSRWIRNCGDISQRLQPENRSDLDLMTRSANTGFGPAICDLIYSYKVPDSDYWKALASMTFDNWSRYERTLDSGHPIAWRHLTRAAERGFYKAFFNRAESYMYENKPTEAFRDYMACAKRGDARGQYEAGMLISKFGIAGQSPDLMIRLLCNAARQCHVQSLFVLADTIGKKKRPLLWKYCAYAICEAVSLSRSRIGYDIALFRVELSCDKEYYPQKLEELYWYGKAFSIVLPQIYDHAVRLGNCIDNAVRIYRETRKRILDAAYAVMGVRKRRVDIPVEILEKIVSLFISQKSPSIWGVTLGEAGESLEYNEEVAAFIGEQDHSIQFLINMPYQFMMPEYKPVKVIERAPLSPLDNSTRTDITYELLQWDH